MELPPNATLVLVNDTRSALSRLAAAFYGDPSQALEIIGVTGTNGKTTTAHFIASILNEAGISCAIAGTVGVEFRGAHRTLENTTPLPHELHGLLAWLRDDGAKAVAMEVSSHALALGRVDDVRFRAGVLTNVARDHLDFHETIETYAAAKRRLFDLASAAVLNTGDAYGARWAGELEAAGVPIVTYGGTDAPLAATSVEVSPDETRFDAGGAQYRLRLAGRFNVSNALAALGVARILGIDDAASARGLYAVQRVAGRMERIGAQGIDVVVDYAHTPDALENVLRALRETSRGGVSVVFGCGGDRDRGKRPEMGAIAAQLADRLYVTSDNPRTEDARSIADAIVAGIGGREHALELDRRRAIERAIAEAAPGDVVLIAGKGHETYQIIGDRVLPFDDVAIAREALAARAVLR